jgi:hypothetical protein
MAILMYGAHIWSWTKADISKRTAADEVFKEYRRKNQNGGNKNLKIKHLGRQLNKQHKMLYSHFKNE